MIAFPGDRARSQRLRISKFHAGFDCERRSNRDTISDHCKSHCILRTASRCDKKIAGAFGMCALLAKPAGPAGFRRSPVSAAQVTTADLPAWTCQDLKQLQFTERHVEVLEVS